MTRHARVFNASGSGDWRWGLERSRLCVLLWSADPRHAALQRQKLAYAQQLGKPIRILLREGDRLPEDLCAGYADVETARVGSPATAGPLIQAWLDALDIREGETP
jgi:hypothetical protein